MRKSFLWLAALSLASWANAADLRFSFDETPVDQTPTGFRSAVGGAGKPGDWRIVLDSTPSAFQTLTPMAQDVSRRPVLAQLSQDPADERFPILIFDGDTYGDFTLTTRFKIVSGGLEQMAGVAFRIQDEKNYYVVRASALGNNFRFYKVVNGMRGEIIGPETEITRGVWHDLKIQCQGNQIRCWLNGRDLIPPLTDNSFSSGKIGFWTKSDSVSYFADTALTYKPREIFAKTLVRDMVNQKPRIRGLAILVPAADKSGLKVIASSNESEVGRPGGKFEQDVFDREAIFQAKEHGDVNVLLPLRDRNGETIGVVHLLLESFPGQTEQNVLSRSAPLVKEIQMRAQTLKDLTD